MWRKYITLLVCNWKWMLFRETMSIRNLIEIKIVIHMKHKYVSSMWVGFSRPFAKMCNLKNVEVMSSHYSSITPKSLHVLDSSITPKSLNVLDSSLPSRFLYLSHSTWAKDTHQYKSTHMSLLEEEMQQWHDRFDSES